MKEIVITFENGGFHATANPPITFDDQIILFTNLATQACQINFMDEAAFGIMGITLGPGSGFTLIYRGKETAFRLSPPPLDSDTKNPTIPPGTSFRKKHEKPSS